MLRECAPGATIEEKTHHYRVTLGDHVFPTLPKGQHGKRAGRGEIEIGHLRKMIRQLGIDTDCAARHIERLRG